MVVAAVLAAFVSRAYAKTEPVDYVSTLVGTASKHSFSTGNTYPATAIPWGMNAWTPQTGKMGDGWTYTYWADKIRGLKQTHQPSPWIGDYGQLAVMPETGAAVFDEEQRASWFSHKTETAKPHYYSVYLADYDVWAEVAPTERAAVLRFTYPQSDSSHVVVDALDGGSYVRVLPGDREIVGYTTKNSGGVPVGFRNYFVMEFDKDFSTAETYSEGKPTGVLESKSVHAGAIVGFATSKGEKVSVKVATSFISVEQARLNLREVEGKTFGAVVAEGRGKWNEVLGRVELESGDTDRLRTFYSCLYRSLLFPRGLHEVDVKGDTVHYSPYDGKVHPGYMFTDTGFWDTFRSLFPLLNLLYPSQAEKIQRGLANAYRESGFLPEWASPGHRDCMVGNNSASVVADAWLCGLRGDFSETLWEAVVHGAAASHPDIGSTGRAGWSEYNSKGYVPCDIGLNESAARTLEYAYDDWCIYQMGRSMGKSRRETGKYAERAMNYRNLFDKSSGLMRGRKADGSFAEPFNPLKWGGDFTEGNSWHYTWSVFHDVAGLVSLMGGEKVFNAMLDSVFNLPPVFDCSYYGGVIHEIREMQVAGFGNYAHGNQPAQHMAYLYSYSGEPWKTQYWVREVVDRLYSAAPDGYCGDEDNGQTSAWYVFSSLGFYPVCPGSGQFVIGTPSFPKAVLHLENGVDAMIEASGEGPYIQKAWLGGVEYGRNYLSRGDLLAGAGIRFLLGTEPNKARGISKDARPYSFSEDN